MSLIISVVDLLSLILLLWVKSYGQTKSTVVVVSVHYFFPPAAQQEETERFVLVYTDRQKNVGDTGKKG